MNNATDPEQTSRFNRTPEAAANREAVARFKQLEREGFSFDLTRTHFEELIDQGLSLEHAGIAVRIAERRETAGFYPKCAEIIHWLCSRLGNTPAGFALRHALNDDSESLAKAAARVGVTKQTLGKSEARIRERLTG